MSTQIATKVWYAPNIKAMPFAGPRAQQLADVAQLKFKSAPEQITDEELSAVATCLQQSFARQYWIARERAKEAIAAKEEAARQKALAEAAAREAQRKTFTEEELEEFYEKGQNAFTDLALNGPDDENSPDGVKDDVEAWGKWLDTKGVPFGEQTAMATLWIGLSLRVINQKNKQRNKRLDALETEIATLKEQLAATKQLASGLDLFKTEQANRIEWLEGRAKDLETATKSVAFESEVLSDEHGVFLHLKCGDETSIHRLPVPFDAGIYRHGQQYPKGAIVNGKGLWIAQCDTRTKPGENNHWRLLIQKPRDGRDGKDLTWNDFDGDKSKPTQS